MLNQLTSIKKSIVTEKLVILYLWSTWCKTTYSS